MDISSFYIDKYPVTNKQFKAFLDATHYHPKDDHNFLKDWHNGNYPKGWENKPVTWISQEDARAYCKWAGKRLPHEWEWQYAAQGSDNRLYPWGNEMDSTKMPPPDTSRVMRPPTAVDAFPQGASPFGVTDMIGNVWQWTDEYIDAHTRAAVLKGGGYYRPTTSRWYFPRAYELNKYGKYLLMAPSLDRSGSIGFRCVMDNK
jgi:formylglycine-generating enzyme required for sulfatase activity